MDFQAPMTAAVAAIATAIASLATWWGEDDNEVHLMKSDTNIDANMSLGGITEADFDGSAEIVTTAVPVILTDPTTGRRYVKLVEPAGGFSFKTTGATNLPQTIYGAYVTTTGGAKLLGAVKFREAINLTAVGQFVDLGSVQFPLSETPLGV